jgi:TM2 domain-containing membrane protein YozV
MAMGSGSCGNVIAALASFFIPGLGQLLQGRWLLAGVMFVLTALLWLILLGWIIHLWSIIDAALYRSPEPYGSRYRTYERYY